MIKQFTDENIQQGIAALDDLKSYTAGLTITNILDKFKPKFIELIFEYKVPQKIIIDSFQEKTGINISKNSISKYIRTLRVEKTSKKNKKQKPISTPTNDNQEVAADE